MTTEDHIEDILDICLDRLQSGDSVQACLDDYPQHADELAPMLQAASMLQPLEPVPPIMSTKAFHRNANRLYDRAAELRAATPTQTSTHSSGVLAGLAALFLGPSRRLALTLATVVLLLTIVGAGTVAASTDSLPGDPLYTVKRTTETVLTALPRSPDAQTQRHLQLAERRLQETERLLAERGTVNGEVLADMERELERARESAAGAGDDALRQVLTQTEQQTRVLEQIRTESPADTQQQLQQTLTTTERIREQVRADLGEEAPDGVPADDTPTPIPADDTPGQSVTPTPTRTPKASAGFERQKGKPTELPVDRGQRRRGTPTPGTGAQEPEQGTGNAPETPPGQEKQQDAPGNQPSGPPPDAGPPDNAGPPEGAGPPDDAGPPDNAGPPADTGKPDDPGGGNSNNNDNQNKGNNKDKDKDKGGKGKDK